jgi:hypothetical protein
MRRSRLLALLLCGIVACLSVSMCHAQDATGEIDGVVRDAQGLVVVGATVEITNANTKQLVRTLTTDETGIYSAPLLTVATYNVSATAPGFAGNTITGIELHIGQQLTIDLALKVGSADTEVKVTGDAAGINTDSSEVGNLVSGNQLAELAMKTDNFQQVIMLNAGVSYGGPDTLNPGMVSNTGNSNKSNMSVNGLRASQNTWLLDGVDVLNHGGGGQVNVFPAMDAIQEMKILRNNYSAQYGGGGSAQIQVISKAGSSEYHGDGYYMGRNSALNARNYFDHAVVEPDKMNNTFGYSFGGPVMIPHVLSKKKANTFFFVAQQFQRNSDSNPQNQTNVPTAQEKLGIFTDPVCVSGTSSNCKQWATQITNIDPTAQAYINDVLSKIPNGGTDTTATTVTTSNTSQNQTMVRFDHAFTPRLNTFIRVINDTYYQDTPNGLWQASSVPGVGNSHIDSYGRNFNAHLTYVLTPTTLLDGGYAWGPYDIRTTPTGLSSPQASPDFRPTLLFPSQINRIPTVSINGTSYTSAGPSEDKNSTHQVFVNATRMMGTHTVQFGGNFEHFAETINQGSDNAGIFKFQGGQNKLHGTTAFEQSFANFLLGDASNFTQSSIDPVAHLRQNIIEAYVQDDWKVTSRLTLNIGVRYSLYSQPIDAGNNLGAFEPGAYNAALAPTIDSNGNICIVAPCAGGGVPNPNYARSAWNGIVLGGSNSPYGQPVSSTPKTNFAPRFGFALNMFGDGKTVLRGGYGIFYNQEALYLWQDNVWYNPAYVQSVTIASPTSFANPGTGYTLSNAPVNVYGIQGPWKTPYTQAWNLTVEEQLGSRSSLQIGYSGNKTTHLVGTADINQPLPGAVYFLGATGSNVNINQIRPYAGYTAIMSINPWYTSNYNGLQTSFVKRFGRQGIIGVNYTWSKALTTANSESAAPDDVYDIASEYGPAQFNREHMFNAQIVYPLPYHGKKRGFAGRTLSGWSLTGIIRFGSGQNLTPIVSADPAQQGILVSGATENSRPDVSFDPNNNAPHTVQQWFNTSAFQTVPSGQYRDGNASNGCIVGPGYQDWNLGARKELQVTERVRLQFRVEASNVFNHPSWSNIALQLNTNNFGQVTSARDPRKLRFGVRARF